MKDVGVYKYANQFFKKIMKFIVGDIPKDENFTPKEGNWKSLPSYNFSISYGISFFGPFFFAGLFLMFIYFLLLWITGEGLFDSPYEFFPALFLSLAFVPIFHEVVRAVVCPEKDVDFGIVMPNVPANWIMAYFNGNMSRNRLLLILGFPLIFSIIPILICAIFEITSPWITIPALINAFSSYSDLVLIYLVFVNTPKDAEIQVNGLDIWFKTVE